MGIVMNKELYIIAAEEAGNVYTHADYQVGPRKTVEFSIVKRELKNGMWINVLAIRGTDEWRDWFKNLDIRSAGGWKRPVYDAACLIGMHLEVIRILKQPEPVLICSHSKGGPTAFRVMQAMHRLREKIGLETFCVAFDPARGLKKDQAVYLENTVIFRDPDSIVSYLGWSRFKHPGAKCITLPNDVTFSWLKPWTWVKQHSMSHFLEFVRGMKGDE